MSTYKITSTTTHGNIEAELIEAGTAIEAAFLMGVQFGVQSAIARPDAFEFGMLIYKTPKKASEFFVESVRVNLASLEVEEV